MEYVGNILYDDELLESENKFVIFGAGVYGRKVLEYLELNGAKDKIICFCDSNGDLDGESIEEIPVCRTKDVFDKYYDASYIVSGRYSDEMYHVLRENGINKIHMLLM